jgi:hypothetical protein
MSEVTAPSTQRCAVTGEETAGKLYVLRTTEGEELVSPRALLGPREPSALVRAQLRKLEGRVERLEQLLTDLAKEDQGGGQEDDVKAAPKPSPSKKTAAAAKKADS